MNEAQIQEAELRFTEVFLPAVKGLKRHGSMDVVLDSLFEGEDNAGEFVVRFEVTITRYSCSVDGASRGYMFIISFAIDTVTLSSIRNIFSTLYFRNF